MLHYLSRNSMSMFSTKVHMRKISMSAVPSFGGQQPVNNVHTNLPTPSQLEKHFKLMNEKDKYGHLNDMKKTLKHWSPSKDHLQTLQNSTNEALLEELDYIRALYTPPLTSIRRINLRHKLLNHFNKATVEEQKYIYSILQYYKLVDE